MFDSIPHKIVSRRNEITEHEFIQAYKDKNIPVVLSNLMSAWPAKKKWNIDYLKKTTGDQVVPVYSSKPACNKQHQHAASRHIKLSAYLTMLEEGENDLRMFFYNILNGAPSLLSDFAYPNLE